MCNDKGHELTRTIATASLELGARIWSIKLSSLTLDHSIASTISSTKQTHLVLYAIPYFQRLTMFNYILSFLLLTTSGLNHGRKCKSTPDSRSWPSDFEWAKFNSSISGQLLRPTPPGSVCHPSQPDFDLIACSTVVLGWKTTQWHSDNPVSTPENNWNNDTCLPIPSSPCTGKGYPIYVVNATSVNHVKKGVDFVRRNNIRLIVKGTGHDYLGRRVLFISRHNF